MIGAMAIIATYVSVLLCNKLLNHSSHNMKMSKLFRNTQIICSIGCSLNIYSDFSRFIVALAINTNDLWHDPMTQIYSHADAFYYLGAISFYIIAILRLNTVFQNTAYEINKYYFYFVCTLIVISICTATYYCFIVAILLGGTGDHVQEMFFKYDGPATIILMIIDFILNSNLMVLFVYKLHQLLVSTQYIVESNSNSMVDVMTRHTILFGIAIGTNQLFFVSLVIGIFEGALSWWVYIFRSTENLVNIIVLYLSLSINRDIYMRFCGKINNAVKTCCVNQITQKEVSNDDLQLTIEFIQ